MTKPKEANIFETQDVGLASYLMLEGIKFIECRPHPSNSRVIMIRFLDDKQNCLDLERVYINSQHKRFRDLNKYLLDKIHEVKNQQYEPLVKS